MFYHAKNGTIQIGTTDMDYISFGSGSKNLIMIPGVGDGLKTVRGTAAAFALMYRIYAKRYRVYVFSRKNRLSEGYSTRDMARDLKAAMEQLDIEKADVIGISQGGMIAQYLAIDYPDAVGRLVLTVTLARANETICHCVEVWTKMALEGDFRAILIDTAERSYTEAYLRKCRPMYGVIAKIGKPKDFSRFLIQADACIHHDAYGELDKISCPVLVIGGACDNIVGAHPSKEIADRIKDCRLRMYEEYGHGLYEEAKDFNDVVMEFFGG